MTGIVQDITDRKCAEATLRESERCQREQYRYRQEQQLRRTILVRRRRRRRTIDLQAPQTFVEVLLIFVRFGVRHHNVNAEGVG